MKLLFKITAILILFHVTAVMAQDVQFTQFYSAPINLNPAFAGANVCSRVTMVYRNQWPGISGVYKTKLVSFDHFFHRSNIGIGLTFVSDEAGSGTLKTTVVNPAISYEARINHYSGLRFGLQPGIGNKSINMNGLLFGDQIYRGGNVATVEAAPQSKTYFDLAAGAIYFHSNYWAGISGYHLTQPYESLYGSPYTTLPTKYSIHMGAKFDLNKSERDPRQKKYIMPVFHYRGQSKFDQIDVGFYYVKYIFTVGMWYRGIPGLKAYQPGYPNNDAVAFLAGVQTERIKVGYSYDRTISGLATISRGAHEITLSFQMCNPKKRKTRYPLISCPKF